MKVFRLRSLSDYQTHAGRIWGEHLERNSLQIDIANQLSQSPMAVSTNLKRGQRLKRRLPRIEPPTVSSINLRCGQTPPVKNLSGYSYTAEQYVDFSLTMERPINWRETVACPVSGLPNRIRSSIHIMDLECAPYRNDRIYLMEQRTLTYQYLKSGTPILSVANI